MPRPLPPTVHKLDGHDGYSGFDYAPFGGGATRPVFWRGPDGRPGILVLHELPGLAEVTVQFADRLVNANYRVFMPVLFGKALHGSEKLNAAKNLAFLCVRAEFGKLAGNVTAPVTDWLRALARDISTWCDDGKVGAIGMCLTGGFIIPLMLDPTIGAAVASQPSIPLVLPLVSKAATRRALNVSPQDLRRAAEVAQATDQTLLGFRFSSDSLCPKERFDALGDAFGDSHFEQHTYQTPDARYGLGKRAHAVLTTEYPTGAADPAHPSLVATERLLQFLSRRLG